MTRLALVPAWWVGAVLAASGLEAQDAADGRRLVEALGCGSCHAGVGSEQSIRSVAPRLGPGSAPLAPAYVFHYLADPQPIRADVAPARMPTYDLGERERVALAVFVADGRALEGVDDAFAAARDRHAGADAAEGRILFERMNCAACHDHARVSARRSAPDLSALGSRVRPEWLKAYLADPVPIRPAGPSPGGGGRMPDFRLSASEVAAVAEHLGRQRAVEFDAWAPAPLSAFAMEKANALLTDRWSCLGCHRLGSDGGRVGPSLDGVRHRLEPEFLRAVIEDPDHAAPGTVMPASLERSDRIDLIASHLLQREGEWTGAERVALPAAAASVAADPAHPGAALYGARCAPCHGVAGGGDGFNAPFLPAPPTAHSDSAAMSLRPDDTLYDGIHAGAWILGGSARMPAFGASLDDERIRALVDYIRALCRCAGPAWSRDGAPPRRAGR